MPSVSAVLVGPNALTVLQITDGTGTTTLHVSDIPGTLTLAADIENWINTNWCNQFTRYQVLVHVLSTPPLRIAVWIMNPGVTAPSNWWTVFH